MLMFDFLSAAPTVVATRSTHRDKTKSTPYSSLTVLSAALAGVLFLSGCQQQTEPPVADDIQAYEPVVSVEDNEPMPQSKSATARIAAFEPIYVTQFQSLQRRLQAEYESLQAADASEGEEALLSDASESATSERTDATSVEGVADMTAETSAGESDEEDINTSTEVGERDLAVLKRISLVPRQPDILTEEQIIARYQQAMAALYQSVTTPLSAEEVNTLINIATLTPQLFEHAEIAGRLSAKSPALARLIIQHQVWEQIEAQQVMDIQQMKVRQQQEFEALMAKFNKTIKDYDEQIAKYEQTLKKFQQ